MADDVLRVERSVLVACAPADAFDLWTRRLHVWWPLATHSFGRLDATSVEIEPRVGGEIIERSHDGSSRPWGTVLVWDPPHLLRHTWYLGFTPEQATEVEVRFAAAEGGQTRVTVIQTGFERLGSDARPRRDGNESGWAAVMPCYVAALPPPR